MSTITDLDITSYIFEENNPAGIKAVLADKGIGNGKVDYL